MTTRIVVAAAALAVLVAACGDGSDSPAPGAGDDGAVAAGMAIYRGTCRACHGSDAKGVSGLGRPLIGSAFVDGLTDDELVTFITEGRPVDDPANTTGMAMPPKGNNASLSDEDLHDLVAYIRSLQ